jgi:hypothetical protein
MLVMVIERYRDPGAAAVYERAHESGRMMPDGVRYVASWVDANLRRCFQVMECDRLAQLSLWIKRWSDLARPTWPTHDVPKQIHHDFRVPTVEELRRRRQRAEDLGATLLYDRTDDEEPLYVLAVPARHPFCILVGAE